MRTSTTTASLEYRRRKVIFVDLNEEGEYVIQEIVGRNLHLIQVRLAARLFDPAAFVLGAALLKAHDNVVATLSVKNMVMAAPLHSATKKRRPGTINPGTTRATARSK